MKLCDKSLYLCRIINLKDMKKIFILLAVLAVSNGLFAQTGDSPFAGYGYKKHIMYTSSKGEFEEFHDRTDIV